jgi:parallel beta-helix repeat protein
MNQRVYSRPRRLILLSLLLAVFAALSPASPARVALAAPAVRYDAFNHIIYVGADYSPSDPAQAPYVGYPSHPQAPKSPITIPEIAAALNDPALLQSQGGGAWLLKADMVISQTARLEATNATISWLRLDSTPGTKFPALTHITARGGSLLIQDIKVTSWAGSDVDTNYFDGRSYLLAESGGRMDIIRSEVAYLGWSAGEPSGLAWRLRAGFGGDDPVTPDNIKFGATGSIKNSNIHNNYFGQYSFEAYGLSVLNNEFHDNAFYGFDPHDYSTGFEVAYNKVYNNGKHGIIFSRGCTLNNIHHNEVYGNAEHGIMLDRGSNVNVISDNIVYNNSDGVAIFQSEKNLVQNNTLHDNNVGVRINATFDQGDVFDGLSTENTVLNNTIQNNLQYGIYLYERADKNTLQGNTIMGNAGAGVYIKTGGNHITGNRIAGNADGITVVGKDPITPGGLAPSYDPGHKNVIQGNTIEDNDDNGIQFQTAIDNQIGLNEIGAPNPAQANIISTNGNHGISIDADSAKNLVYGNTIQGNGGNGVTIKGPPSGALVDSRNTVTRNSITANGRQGIAVDPTANRGLAKPAITSAPGASVVTGTAAPSVKIEIYRDANAQARVYKGSTTANGAGAWSFTLPASDNPQEGGLTALAIDQYGNTSELYGTAAPTSQAIYQIGAGANGDLTIFISGPGARVTLPAIQQAVQAISPTTTLLANQGGGVWQANASLFLNRGVTLTLTLDTAKWLKLRSQAADIRLGTAAAEVHPNYKSFTTLRTYGGAILIDGTRVTSWDPQLNTYDTDVSNGRSYLLAKYDARMDILNADVSYLGSADGESYGVSWRDINDVAAPDVLRTRVTGTVLNSTFSYNYYGIYTFQASNMVFRNNTFRNNIGYGFDPHDFSHHFTIEDNQAYANGNHGFIVSRGVNNFVFRRNKSYNNRYTIGNDDRHAQGFMLDPGSPNSRFPQEPSHDNLLEDNQAWGNDGYALRVVGSTNNTIQRNTFSGNLQGVTLEQNSTGNIIRDNTIAGSQLYGVYLIGGSDSNTLTGNTVTGSGKHGIYFKTGKNTITGNTVANNGTVVGGVPAGSGIASYADGDVAAAAADLRLPGAAASLAASDPDLIRPAAQASAVAGNLIANNTVRNNADKGIELKSASGTDVKSNTVTANGTHGIYLASGASDSMIELNTVSYNGGHGIRANGLDVADNTWTKNLVYGNRAGGIAITSGANNGAPAPTVAQDGQSVTITTTPGATLEIYSDAQGQGQYFEARVVASTGTVTLKRAWKGAVVNATATDASGNSSGFALNRGFAGGVPRVFMPLIKR